MSPEYKEWLMSLLTGKVSVSNVRPEDIRAAAEFALGIGILPVFLTRPGLKPVEQTVAPETGVIALA